jgi:phosphorylase kinase alpha/beta subunit
MAKQRKQAVSAGSRPPKRDARSLRLETYRSEVEAIILARQNPQTGLLPASTALTVHGDYTHAWVRDNVYSIQSIWALALAYRRQDVARAAPLEQATTQLMRGLLASMMRQAHKVERFKHTQDPLDALHAKYATSTGEPVVADSDWGHLQIDATALFLLMLARMCSAGLPLVQTLDEVCFVQNLVHYLARAYRTPDFGIWERGHKRNEGRAELNASSVGMAKAALEAVDGLVLLPGQTPAIHVQPDDVAFARKTLKNLLPRESASKETDAALLTVVGFPAFAVEEADLADRTRALVVEKLQGRYGCKRFLRDGHQTAVEDPSRLYYEPGELSAFEHIESEWPLFFAYLLIDAQMRGDEEQAASYRAKLEGLMQERDGQRLLPELYFVPAELIELERKNPGSQSRQPNENVPLVWAQSLYMVGVLLQEGYITAADLRLLQPPARREVCVQIALLAADELVRARLATHGIAAQTASELEPLQIRSANVLASAYAELGRSEALGLTGRPMHRLGSLVTSQLFTCGAGHVVFLPDFLDRRGFYLPLDNRLLVDEIKAELAYICGHWRGDGEPLLLLQIAESMLKASGSDELLAFLAELAGGSSQNVRVGALSNLLPVVRTSAIDWLQDLPTIKTPASQDAQALALSNWDEAATRPLTIARATALERERDAGTLLAHLARSRNPYEQIEVLGLLWRRHGPAFETGLGATVRQLTESVYAAACDLQLWGVVRHAAGWLGLHDEALEDAVARIVVRQKRVAVGRSYAAGSVIDAPLTNAELVARLREFGGDDVRVLVLIQEILLLLGTLIQGETRLFAGMLTLRPWYLLQLLIGWLAREHGVSQAEAFEHLLTVSPHAVLIRLREVIASEADMSANLVRSQHWHDSGRSDALTWVSFPAGNDPVLADAEGGWLVWRETAGAILRVPEDFYARTWELLRHTTGLFIGDQFDARNRLDSNLARSDMTASERGFALQIEDLLNKIQAPEYRQLTLETMLALSDIFRANPRLLLDDQLVIDVLIGVAVRLGWEESHEAGAPDAYIEQVAEAWQAFYASPPHRVANLIMAAVALLLVPAAEAS